MASTHPYNQIILFGDSITQFSFDPQLLGYGALLANAYVRKVDVINRGFSGYNTDWALPILRQLLPTVKEQEAQACRIHLMTIFFGANDAALPMSPQHVPLDRFESNLLAMIDLVRSPASRFYNPTLRLILITPPPINEVQWKKRCEEQGDVLNRTNEAASRYAECVRQVGQRADVVVADIWTRIMKKTAEGEGRDLSEFMLDGLHLNRNGYQELYDLLLEIIANNFKDIHPDQLGYELAYWRDLVGKENPLKHLHFPLLQDRKID
ncbi:SGNH hydrolase-type esterase domain-containing protein [Cokeromyces recurvatus]|uniref:SGNH hydrolase-type esterase domain-containing protein n=1 Tax=Cokeromyces recurvatus TaxID=90255 RepID=UPI00221E5208|nr:SGNH hydrolase-type esterase domain-containing protein [Cokeromyces recurvatus]KAI7897612.1 SGNH hydrolase-type esterase domain-containing protein [Cokeromyces recurvatus]